MKTILSALQTWTQKKIKNSTADWNENDSSKDSYIKNRTHWEEQDGTIHKLDKKYLDLPTNLATTDDVESAKQEALEVANTAVANAATAQTTADSKMDTTNPVGAGSFNMNQSQVGDYAISLGYKSKATGKYSHADGYYTKTSTDYQHVGGKYNIEEVPFLKYEENNYSLSIDLGVSVYISNGYDDDQTTGTFTLKKPQQVLSENLPTNTAYFFALSNNSDTIYLYYAEETTIEVSSDKVVISNVKKTSFIQNSCKAHIVGNGMSNTKRSNAHTLDWEGNAWYSGDVYVGSTSGTNRDEGSKKLATVEEVQELASQISPQPYVAQTEAPEDKNLLWIDLDDESDDEGLADAIQAAIADVKNVAIPAPKVAEVGQTVVVKEVDESGKPIVWEAVDFPSGGSIPEKVEFTIISEGIIPAGSDGTTAIDTGVTWADLKDYDWFEIAVGTNVGTSGQKYYFFNRSTPPEAWRRFMLVNGYIGKARFKKIANGVYEWFSQSNAVAISGVIRNTSDYDNFPVALNGPLNSLVDFKHWLDTDKFYIYPSVQVPSDQTFNLCGIRFK